jgi:transposase
MGQQGIEIARLDHLGIVAGVCREIGIADYLDARDAHTHDRVGVGSATVAMVLNGLGFANRRLYLVSQFFKTKPVAHLLGLGITVEDLNDECLGRTLDWLYAHDPTALFAGIATQARQRLGLCARELHVDTTSFSVSGEYASSRQGPQGAGAGSDLDAQAIAITYGYAREHRHDLKQWMLAVATSGEGAIPVFLRPLNGNASDQRELAQTIEALVRHLQEAGAEPGLYVADAGVYSAANLRRFTEAGVRWISRVPATSREASALLGAEPEQWARSADGGTRWFSRPVELGHGRERWIVVVTEAGLARVRAPLTQRAQRDRDHWERQLWHLGNQAFACQADAEAAAQRQRKTVPVWLQVAQSVSCRPHYAGKGRPPKGQLPDRETWHVQAQVTLDQAQLEREVQRQARLLVATNVLAPLEVPDEQVIGTYKAQSGVERGFAFLKEPLFLAASVFLQKPERIMALSLVMVFCLLVCRLAEWRLRQQLAATDQTVPHQLKPPTARPTMRWMVECFEGISLLTLPRPGGSQTLVHGLEPLHERVLSLLGPAVSTMYETSNRPCSM